MPKLRFPEFRDAPAWQDKQLAKICEMRAGKFVAASAIHEAPAEGLYPCFGGNGLRGYTKTYTHTGKYPLIGRQGALCGNVTLATGRFHATEHAVVASPRSKVDENWLFYLLTRLGLNQYATGQAQPGLSVETLKEISACTPIEEEQQKVGSCLSSIDAVIAAQTQELDAIKAHKNGLMQQLFPAEGETVPKLRFLQFRNAPAWQEKRSSTLFINRVEEGDAGLPIYSVTMNDGMIRRSLLDRRCDDIAEPGGNKRAYKDDIAYNMMRMWQGAFGVASEDCMVSPAYVILGPRDGVCSDFFAYLLKLPRYLRLLTSHSQGLTADRLRLYYKDFAHISLSVPALPEQRKIAEFLSSVDELIAAQTEKLEALKAHKKGLMQQLFPSADEVHG